MNLIPYPIPEADRQRLINAGKKVCQFHHPRDQIDSKGYAEFVRYEDYRIAHKAMCNVENHIRQKYGVQNA